MRKLTVLALFSSCLIVCQAQTLFYGQYNDISTFSFASSDSYLWSSIFGGLARVSDRSDKNHPEMFTEANSELPSDYVSSLASVDEEILWVGTDRGLASWDDGIWTLFTKENSGLLSDNIMCLEVDSKGTLWVGSDSGINSHMDGKWTSLRTGAEVQALEYDDATGTLWAGMAGGIISKLNGDRLVEALRIPRYESYPGFFEDNYVNDLKLDSQERLWAALASGLECYSGGSWKHYSSKDLKLTGMPQALGVDRTGVVWVGGIGLSYFDGKQWIDATKALKGQPFGNVRSIEGLKREFGYSLIIATSEVAEIGGGLCLIGVDPENTVESAVWVMRNNVFQELKIADRWEHVDDIPEEAWWDIDLYGDPVRFIVASSLLGSPMGMGRKVWYDVDKDVFHGQGIELVPQPVPDLSSYFTMDDKVPGDQGMVHHDSFISAFYSGDYQACERMIAQGFDVNDEAGEFCDDLMQEIRYFYPNDTSYLEMSEAEIALDIRSKAHYLARYLTELKHYGLRLQNKSELLSEAIDYDMPELVIEAIRQY